MLDHPPQKEQVAKWGQQNEQTESPYVGLLDCMGIKQPIVDVGHNSPKRRGRTLLPSRLYGNPKENQATSS